MLDIIFLLVCSLFNYTKKPGPHREPGFIWCMMGELEDITDAYPEGLVVLTSRIIP